MASYKHAIEKVIINEGGYENDPDDSGGETYLGISRNNFPKWKGWLFIDREVKRYPNSSNKMMTYRLSRYKAIKKYAIEFYKDEFWNEIKGNDIVMQDIAESILDFCVNTGVSGGSKIVQKVVGCKDDGDIGPTTIRYLNNYTLSKKSFEFKLNFFVQKAKKYESISNKGNNIKYLFGWLSRSFYPLEEAVDINLLNKYQDIKEVKEVNELYNFIKRSRKSRIFRSSEDNILKLKLLINKLT